MSNRWGKASANCAYTTARDTGFTSYVVKMRSSSFSVVAIRVPKAATSNRQRRWPETWTRSMSEKLIPYDAAEALGTADAIDEFMKDAFESGDAGYIAHAIGIVARAKGMTEVAKETGM